ncbi:hypothetical protein [Anaeromyxobacter diazotrophicus]|uniref:Uncharacterized protein n=1 Tax=Anaeromyxobacter diazotrophicus TaxID=2590199 RepID=A0A7I9VSM7_9BACT|nr:hypothetical protein [Anaeromyxobacter diazotrophicus]GEJ59130.1 hypothetical protein AMYX_38710 [Anaeromyxobacter diazotrophicus]
MPRNDRSDALSVRGEDDPRNPLKALEQETELELGRSEANDTGGAEHRGPGAGEGRGDEPASARRGMKGASGSSTGERSGRDPGAEPARGAVPRRDE